MTLFSVSSEVISLILGVWGTTASMLIYWYDRRLRIHIRVHNATGPGYNAIEITAANLSWKRKTTLGAARLAFPRDTSFVELEGLYRDPQDSQYEIGPGSKQLTVTI